MSKRNGVSAAAFTPGPWRLDDGNTIAATWESGEAVQLAVMAHTHWSYPDGGRTQRLARESEANALLIAAAPDLLDALRECRELFSAIRSDWEDPRTECRAGIACIDAAIAKARP